MGRNRQEPIPKEDIVDAISKGMTNLQMAEQFGRNRGVIYKLKKEYGLVTPYIGRKFHRLKIDETDFTKRLGSLNDGESLQVLADHYKCSYTTITRYVTKFGMGGNWRCNFDHQKVIDAYKRLGSARKVARLRDFGCSLKTITRILKQNEVPIVYDRKFISKTKKPANFADFYKNNVSTMAHKDMAKELDVCVSSIRLWAKQEGIFVKKCKPIRQKPDDFNLANFRSFSHAAEYYSTGKQIIERWNSEK